MESCGRAAEEGEAVSVLIRGMEMPIEKSRIIQIYPDGTVRKLDGSIFNSNFEAIPVPPHGRCIDADEFLKRAIGTKCFRGDYALMLEELVGESTTIIPAETPKEEWIFADLDTIIDCYSDPASEEGE